MKHRNPFAVFFLPFITLGIYGLVWQVKTKNEMNQLGAQIPTAWLLIVPFVNIYWLWKYAEGVEQVTGGKQTAVLAFILLFLLGVIGAAILQLDFNKLADGGTPLAASPAAPQAPVPPVSPTPQVPQDPSTPVNPVDPTTPTEPTQPLQPTQPTPPIQPIQPQPTEPKQPTQPVPPTPPSSPIV